MRAARPLGGRVVSRTFLAALVIVLVALYFLAKRFMFGLGAVTNLNDGYPWGLWIAYDVVTGTAIGCGGYSMALLVYVFNKGRYHPLVRPAVMTSMFGYTLAGVAVFFDIGRYWHIYNLFLPWYANPDSVLLEVALCIALYSLVLWIEFAPTFLAHWHASRWRTRLDRAMFVFIALGILLPTMHQSSLGTMMIAAGQKLSPLWQTAWLPLLFLMTAVIMGYAAVVFESTLLANRYGLPGENRILGKLSGGVVWLVAGYLVVRFADVILRGQLGLAFKGDLAANMFWIENALFLLPLVMLAGKSGRGRPRVLFLAAASLLLAGGVYRFDCYLIGFNPGNGWHYFPAVPEIVITLGLISVELMAYLWFVKRLPVYREA